MKKYDMHLPVVTAIAMLAAVFLFVAPASAHVKIGGVNLQAILDGSDAGKKALDELKAKAEKERAILQEKQENVKKMEKEIEQQRLMLSQTALMDKSRKLRHLKREFELYKEDTQQILQGEQAQVMRKLLGEVMVVIKEYGEKNGYTMIFEKGEAANAMGGFVLYMDKSVDLTSEIIKIYNEKQGAGGKKAGQ